MKCGRPKSRIYTDIPCAYCGTNMSRHSWQINKYKKLYCSRQCKNKDSSQSTVSINLLIKLYTEDKLSLRAISAMVGISMQAVHERLIKAGVVMRDSNWKRRNKNGTV